MVFILTFSSSFYFIFSILYTVGYTHFLRLIPDLLGFGCNQEKWNFTIQLEVSNQYAKKLLKVNGNPASIYLLKVNNRKTRTKCEICSKLTIKTPEQFHLHHSGVFIVKFELISHLVVVFL